MATGAPAPAARAPPADLDEGRVEGEDPLASFSPTAARHLARTDGFPHAPDIMVGSFYDPALDEGCAFEELISFHGGLGGPQTRAFVLHPPGLEPPVEPLVGAAAVHDLLWSWRAALHGGDAAEQLTPATREADDRSPGPVRAPEAR